jgi:serine/threonine protein kinase
MSMQSNFHASHAQRVAEIALAIALLMQAFQAKNPDTYIHCHLKPGNIPIDEDFEPRVADFGWSITNPHRIGWHLEPELFVPDELYVTDLHVSAFEIILWKLPTGLTVEHTFHNVAPMQIPDCEKTPRK